MKTKTKREIVIDVIKAVYTPGDIKALVNVTVGFMKAKRVRLACEWLGAFLAIVGLAIPLSSIGLIIAKALDIVVAISLWALGVNVSFIEFAVDRIHKELNIDLTEES